MTPPPTRVGLRRRRPLDPAGEARPPAVQGRVVLIDDDPEILGALQSLLWMEGYACEGYGSALTYLDRLQAREAGPPGPSCILLDVMMPDLDGLEAQQRLALADDAPLILMSGASGAPEVVAGFRAGALDFLIKPIEADRLLEAVAGALRVSRDRASDRQRAQHLHQRLERLTRREQDVALRVARGDLNRIIARDLRLALRTVKLYRQRAMEKLEAHSTAELVRILQEAAPGGGSGEGAA